MVVKCFFFLVIWLIFFISFVIIIVFFVFIWIMIYLVKVYFEECDVYDFRQFSIILEMVFDYVDYLQVWWLEIVKNIIVGYVNVFICLDDGQGNILFQLFNGLDFSYMLSMLGLVMQFCDGNVILWIDLQLWVMVYDNYLLEICVWWLIMLLLGKQVDGKLVYYLLMVLFIDFYLYYINELKVKLIFVVLIISLLIIVIVLFVVYQGYKLICQISCQIQNIILWDFDVCFDLQVVFVELEWLVLLFNYMLEWIEDVFICQFNFFVDIVYEICMLIINLVM